MDMTCLYESLYESLAAQMNNNDTYKGLSNLRELFMIYLKLSSANYGKLSANYGPDRFHSQKFLALEA